MTDATAALAKLREPFPPNQISKLPKETKAQIDARKNNREGVNCPVCGGWHHPRAVHLDYVGHAALTDRLLDVDPAWSWEPVAFDDRGLPARDQNGGLWIRLTVAGVSRLGYGSADGKSGGDAVKELIGDALRNAAMRFGAALDLWHKGDLHADEGDQAAREVMAEQPRHDPTPADDPVISDAQWSQIVTLAEQANVSASIICKKANVQSVRQMPARMFDTCKTWLEGELAKRAPRSPQASELLSDDIPY